MRQKLRKKSSDRRNRLPFRTFTEFSAVLVSMRKGAKFCYLPRNSSISRFVNGASQPFLKTIWPLALPKTRFVGTTGALGLWLGFEVLDFFSDLTAP